MSTGRSVVAVVCEAVPALLGVAGATVVLVSAFGDVVLAASDDRFAELEDRQTALGEGPRHDAVRIGAATVHSDVAAQVRWPEFVTAAAEAKVAAVVVLPIEAAGRVLGTLTLYGDEPESLTPIIGRGVRLAEQLAGEFLSAQAEAAPEALAAEVEEALDRRIPQATGLLAARLDLTAGEAFERLRTEATAAHSSLAATAADVIAGRNQPA